VYERKPPAGAAVWSEWTGTLWMVGTMARSRMGMQRIVSRSQDWPWRGLSRPGGRT
jgi:hypothetical protein